jgi:hypothetical protein
LFYFRYDHVVYDFIYEDKEDCDWFVKAEFEFKKIWLNDYEKGNNTDTYLEAVKELE